MEVDNRGQAVFWWIIGIVAAIFLVWLLIDITDDDNVDNGDTNNQDNQTMQESYTANLIGLNSSNASGTATYDLTDDGMVTVTVNAQGVSPDQTHAQHLHIGGNNVCPDQSADEDDDGFVSTAEGQSAYGAAQIALTSTGDVSSQSILEIERFPMADADGNLSYTRTFSLPSGISEADLSQAVLVQHGIADTELGNDDAAYDGDARSSLTEDLPLEATLPALCGTFSLN